MDDFKFLFRHLLSNILFNEVKIAKRYFYVVFFEKYSIFLGRPL